MPNTFDHGYALLIGVGECANDKRLSLPVTVKDIHALQSILTDPNFCSYPDDQQHIRLLHDTEATRDKILDGLVWLQEQTAKDSEATIFVYFSGHGLLHETGKYYLITHDVEPFDIPNTTLSAEDFNSALRQIKAKRLFVVIDSCHAQGMASAKSEEVVMKLPSGFVQTAPPKGITADLSQGKGRAVFTSCDGGEQSYIRTDNKMSIYTYHLIEALQGAGNQPHDTNVCLSNIMNYLAKAVPESARTQCKAKQTPNFDISSEDFAVAVAMLQGGKGLPADGWEAVKKKTAEKMNQIIQAYGDRSIASGRDVVGNQGTNTGNIALGGDIQNNHGETIYNTQGGKMNVENRNGDTYNQQDSTNYNNQGANFHSEVQFGDRIYQTPEKPKAGFDNLVKGIFNKYRYLENLEPYDADDVWKMLRSASPEEFGAFELKVFKLVVSYCCYYCKRRLTQSTEYKHFGEIDYYQRANELSREGNLRWSSHRLSFIIKATQMAEIIKSIELNN
jgi:hypothetical protein